jgi:hypothetical protein
LALVVVLPACSDEDPYAINSEPAFAGLIDSKPVPDGQCFSFSRDITGGQLPKTVAVRVSNIADTKVSTPKPLCVKYKWENTNSQFAIIVPSSTKALGKAGCDGYDYAVPVGSKYLDLNIKYQADATEDTTTAKLTFTTNDPKRPTVEYCIGIGATGPLPELTPTEYRFVNASKSNPPTQCFSLRNKGSETLTFMGATLDPANAQYVIASLPQSGQNTIPPIGEGDNKDGQKALQICVRYTPDGTADNEDVTLNVMTNGELEKSLISAITQPEAKWRIECNCPSAVCPQLYTVDDTVKSAKCKIINESDTPLKIQDVRVEPAQQGGDSAAVNKAFKAVMIDVLDKEHTVYSLNKDKSVTIRLDYTAPSSGLPPKAVVHFGWSSANNNANKFIAIQAGACDTPALEFGPTPELPFVAGVGATATGRVVLANQSCGSLQVVNACVTAASVTGADPCAKSSSAIVQLKSGFTSTAVASWGLFGIDLTFSPINDNKLTHNDLLHVFYCTGVWDGANCSGGTIERRALNLVGLVNTDSAVLAPQLALTAPSEAENLIVGKPVKIEAQVTPGSYDDQRFFRWTIAARPEGSAAWLPEGNQDTNTTPALVVLPYVAGTYTIIGWVQGISDNGDNRWSPMAEVSFTATAAQ